jgi:rhodanese-related sulfurtransferase
MALLVTLFAAAACDARDLTPMEPDSVSDAADDLADENDALDGADGGGDVPGDDASPPPWPGGMSITCEEVHERRLAADPDMLLLLVSDEEFWSMGMIEGSLVIPWDLLEGRIDEVDPSRNVVVYCRRGVRSSSAHATLQDSGYEHVWIMTDGLERWIELGYPVVDVP